MSHAASRFRCAGCGEVVDEAVAWPFRCPGAGGPARAGRATGANAASRDDIDHVLERELDLAGVEFPPPAEERNPFLRFRELFHVRRVARSGGMDDAELDDLIRALDAAVAEIDGRGFVETPFAPSGALGAELGFVDPGAVWIKDETENVAGSHKARHLFGVLVYLEVRRRLGDSTDASRPTLAIASCGNAALAAAVVAKAGGYPLEVFVPEDADGVVLERLRELDARIMPCPRRKRAARGPGDSDEAGDPCVRRFRERVAAGALPFSCQGNENGLAIEGGRTLGWEMAATLAGSTTPFDRVFVQVGGGALASALIAALRDAVTLGARPRLPRIHAVQTAGGHPLERAHCLVVRRMQATGESTGAALRYAATHRSEFMWPWETPPASLAEGILDDETYDWLAVVRGMLDSGGGPLVVDEDALRRANELAVAASPLRPVGHTGSAGLAGLIGLREAGDVAPDENVAVLFTGVRRGRGG